MSGAMITYGRSRLALRNSAVRIPFRYGSACLTRCPQAMLEVILKVDGKEQVGYSADCLPRAGLTSHRTRPTRSKSGIWLT